MHVYIACTKNLEFFYRKQQECIFIIGLSRARLPIIVMPSRPNAAGGF